MTVRAILYGGTAFAIVVSAPAAAAEETHLAVPIDIPSGPVSVTLVKLAQATHTNILFSPTIVTGVVSRPVKARLTPADAARRMLEGSALYVTADASGALLIRKREAKRAANAGISYTAQVEPLPAPTAHHPAAEPEQTQGIQDIIVTATRRAERLQQIPVAVTAVTGESLRSSGVLDTRQLSQVVPGMVGPRNAGVNQPVIRGIGSGGLVGDESNVATYVDGIYQPDPLTTNLDLVEIARVEVLRGPQGTLFGRNATGGLINVITPDPSFEFRGNMTGTVGVLRSALDTDVRGYVTGGLSDTVAIDFAALYKHNDNFISDIVTGQRAYGNDSYGSLRSKVLFTPNAATKFVLIGDYAKRDGGSPVYQLFENDTAGRLFPGIVLPTGPWQSKINYTPHFGMERYAISFQSHFDIGATALETTGSYQHGSIEQLTDRDSSNIDLGRGEVYTTQRSFSQEVRLLSNGSQRLKWLTGLYYYVSKLDGTIPTTTAGTSVPPALPRLTTRTLAPVAKVNSFAAFAEGTYSLTDTLFVTVGGRYTTEVRRFEQSSNGVPLFVQQRSDFDKFTYRGALRWQFDPQANVYLTYGTGFKSGVYNGVSTASVPTRPENLASIEGGLKADPLSWLRTNLSVFHYDYKGLQVSARDPATNLVLLQNAANAEIYGGEAEITVMPIGDITLTGRFSYLHGEYKDFPNAQGFVRNANNAGNTAIVFDASGKRTVLAPRTTMNLNAAWSHEYGFGRVGGNVNFYRSARIYYDFTNNFSQAPYTLLNGEVFYAPNDTIRFGLGVTNLTNSVVFTALRIGTNAADGIIERPREIKASIRVTF